MRGRAYGLNADRTIRRNVRYMPADKKRSSTVKDSTNELWPLTCQATAHSASVESAFAYDKCFCNIASSKKYVRGDDV